jgi:hypothetical protein
MGLKEDLAIDVNALDQEWLQQSVKFDEYASLAGKAEDAYDRAKFELENTNCELDSQIRADPENYGLNPGDRLTESWVTKIIQKQLAYRRAYEHFLKTKSTYKRLSIAVKSFEHRKDALENLVKLHGQGYFSNPTIRRREYTPKIEDFISGVNENRKTEVRTRLVVCKGRKKLNNQSS